MGGPMHQLVSPEGVLHLLPDDKRARRNFCKAHQAKLRMEYLNKHLAGNEKYKSHARWQLLHKVKWLLQESSGAQVMLELLSSGGCLSHTHASRYMRYSG